MEVKKILLIYIFSILCTISCNENRKEIDMIKDYNIIPIHSNDIDTSNIHYKLFEISDTILVKEGFFNNLLVSLDTIIDTKKSLFYSGWSKRTFNKKGDVTYYELLHIDNKSYVNQQISYTDCNINYDNSVYYEIDKENYLLKLNVFKEFVKSTGNDYIFLLLSKKLEDDLNKITNNNLTYDTIYLDSIYKSGNESNVLQFKLNKNDIYKNGYFLFLSYDKNDKLISNKKLYYKNKSSNMKFECK